MCSILCLILSKVGFGVRLYMYSIANFTDMRQIGAEFTHGEGRNIKRREEARKL